MVVCGGQGDLTPAGSVASFFRAHIGGTSQTSFSGGRLAAAAAHIAGTSGKSLIGRVNGDANRFGALSIHGVATVHTLPHFLIGGKCIINGAGGLSVRGRIIGGDAAECKIFLSVVDPIDNGTSATYSARLIADGTEYKIRAAEYSESKADVGVSLDLTLQRPDQRDAILAAASFQFDVYDNGSWTTLFDTGKLGGGGFSFAWADGRPSDQLTISTIAPIAQKLTKSPDLNTTVYDPFREDINASDFQNILDTNGHVYGHSLIPLPGMSINSLFNWLFVSTLGFSGYVTNIPNFPVRRLDFQMAGNYLDGVRGTIGNFDPLVFVQGTKIYALDSTLRLPAGFATPVVLSHDMYLNAQFKETELDADGYLVTYTEQDSDYDYQQTRDVIIPTSTEGTEGSADYTETDVTQTFTDFYKLSNPGTPVRTEKTKEVTTVRAMLRNAAGVMTLTEISETTENISFDSKMRLTEISQSTIATIPNISSGVPFDFVTDFVRDISQRFEYKPDIFDPKREYLSSMTKKITALVATENDPDKKNVGDTFKQEFFDAWRAGNFTDTMTVNREPVQLVTETAFQTKKGQVEIRQRTTNYMTNPPAVINQVTDGRTGDISQNSTSGSQATIIVYRDGVTARTGRKLVPVSTNMPPIYFIPLFKRKLALRKRRQGTVTMKGLTLSLVRGSAVRVLDRDGTTAGDYLIEGRKLAFNNLGTREQTTRQILEVNQIG
jgi:hypothetical protein